MILLIHPPVAKPSEPPAGIARLSGMLERYGVEHDILDANIEGLLYLLGRPLPPGADGDVWTKRAFRYREHNLKFLKDISLYGNADRYARSVKDIGRALDKSLPPAVSVSLANYSNLHLSPLRSRDLIRSAEHPEEAPFYPFFSYRLDNFFGRKKPSMVGISLNYLSQALCTFSMVGFIRQRFPGVNIVLGGGLVSSWMKNPRWRNPFEGLIDHLVAGPGEAQLLALLGIEAPEGETACPAYSSFPRKSYLSPGFILPYSASTGCYWNRCSFCPERAENNPYLRISSSRVVAELAELAANTRPSLVHLLDNAISPDLYDKLIEEKPPFPWYGFARISRRLADQDFCIALKKAGCVMLKLGIESGDQAVLDAMQKGINIRIASAVLRNLKSAGIAAYVYLLFGTPAETEANARRTLEFAVSHSDCIDFLNLAIFNMPVCGRGDYELVTRDFYEGDLSLYTDFVHPKGWDRKHVRLFLENEFRRHPAISAILRNDPPVLTSNHAPFFAMQGRDVDSATP